MTAPQSYVKTCTACGDILPLARFPKSGSGRLNVCRWCSSAARKKRRSTSAERARRLEREYGLTATEYQSLGARQRWRCAVCGERPRPGKRLVVDHDHATGAVRGLLHSECNAAAGLLKDSPELAEALAAYLRHHGAP